MKPKRRRLYYVLAGMATLGIAVALVLTAFQDNLVFFNSPTDIYEKNIQPDTRFRLGSVVCGNGQLGGNPIHDRRQGSI